MWRWKGNWKNLKNDIMAITIAWYHVLCCYSSIFKMITMSNNSILMSFQVCHGQRCVDVATLKPIPPIHLTSSTGSSSFTELSWFWLIDWFGTIYSSFFFYIGSSHTLRRIGCRIQNGKILKSFRDRIKWNNFEEFSKK